MDVPFTSRGTIELTSTAANQSTLVPANVSTAVIYNGGANPVYFRFDGTTATVPGALTTGLYCIAPGSTQSFSVPQSSVPGTLSYIAKTAGGLLAVSFGDGA